MSLIIRHTLSFLANYIFFAHLRIVGEIISVLFIQTAKLIILVDAVLAR
jgi:hypothetical protein